MAEAVQQQMQQLLQGVTNMTQRVEQLTTNIRTLDQRLTAHEQVHDPYLQVIDGLQGEVNLQAQALNELQVDHMPDLLNLGDRIKAIEAQVAPLTGHGDRLRAMELQLPPILDSVTNTVPHLTNDLDGRLRHLEGWAAQQLPPSEVTNIQQGLWLKRGLEECQQRESVMDAIILAQGQTIEELKGRIQNMMQGAPATSATSSGSAHFELERQEAIKQLPVLTTTKSKLTWEKWIGTLVSQANKVTQWQGILEDAVRRGEEPIDMATLPAHAQELGRAIWALLGYKTEGDPWLLRRNVVEGNGLEHVRLLAQEADPYNAATAMLLKNTLFNHSEIAGPTHVKSVLGEIEHGFSRYAMMTGKAIADDERHSILMRIIPSDVMKAILTSGKDFTTYQAVKDHLLLWSSGTKLHGDLKKASTHTMPMDLGAAEAEAPKLVPNYDELVQSLAALHKSNNQMAALIRNQGLGGSPGKGPGGQAASGTKGGDKGGGGRKGEVKGKGKGATVGGRFIPQEKLRICRDFAKDGQCKRGANCSFPHVSGLPKSLMDRAVSAEGLLVAALGNMDCDPAGTYAFDASREAAVLASLSPKPPGGVGAISGEDWQIETASNAEAATVADILQQGSSSCQDFGWQQ